MKKLIISLTAILVCGSVFGQIYTPTTPTLYGEKVNRILPLLVQHLPEKLTLVTNTTRTEAQIFYYTVDSSIWAWSNARGYWKIGSGNIDRGLLHVVGQYGLVQVNDSTVKVDTNHVNGICTVLWRQKGIDSVVAILSGYVVKSLTNGKIWIGDGSNIPSQVTMSGDGTISNTGVLTLKNTGTAGSYNNVTTDAQGRIISGSTVSYLTSYTETDPLALKISNNLSEGTASTMRVNLGINGWASNMITTANPSGIRFIKINADNSVTLRTAAELLSDIGAQSSGTYVGSVTGTTNRITIGGTSTVPTIDISTSYVGQVTITTLGIIGTGTWNGTAIGTTYGGTPAGGSTSQVLTKINATDYNYSWQTPASGGMTNPMTTLGDIIYEDVTPTSARLAGNTTTTRKFLSQTGNGSISAVPGWLALVSGDIPNNAANTTGSAATLTTPRGIYGNNFDGSAALTQIIASTYGGTGNGFTKFTGPTTSEKTFTLPNASATILTDNAVVTVPQGGIGVGILASNAVLYGNGTGAVQALAVNSTATNKVLTQVSSGVMVWTDPSTFGYGAGTVTSVSGTTNRITSTGGATPVIDISSTFEALLGKVANPLSQFASTTSSQLRGVLSDEKGTGVSLFDGATTPDFTTGITIGGIATSRKMIVGNGTNYVPSTETWAVPGTSRNILISDGTNWTSTTLASGDIPNNSSQSGSVANSLTIDATLFSGGTTYNGSTPHSIGIQSGVVTNAMLAGSIDLPTKVTGALPILNGGSGQTTANAALNAFLPGQTGASGKYLTTDGSNTSWATIAASITVGTSTLTSGTNTRVPFNDAGVYNEDAGLTYNKTTDALTTSGDSYFNGVRVGQGVTSGGGANNLVVSQSGSLSSVTTGVNNVALAYGSLTALTTGYNNTSTGINSLAACTTCFENTSYGTFALGSNIDGVHNSATGLYALYANLHNNNNIANGALALTALNGGFGDQGTGVNSLKALTTGIYNNAYGYSSGFSNIVGDRNIYIGDSSGWWHKGSNCLFLGRFDGNTMIDVNNKMVLSDGQSNIWLTGDSAQNIGIKTFVPLASLHITNNMNSVTQLDKYGILLDNTTAATVGLQSVSPGITLTGKGWKTTATAASQDIRMRIDVLPIQGTTNPSSKIRFQSNINSAGYTDVFGIGSFGELYLGTSPSVGASGQVIGSNGSSAAVSWVTPAVISANNGTTITSNNLQLGGPLVKNTQVDGAEKAWDMDFLNIDLFSVESNSVSITANTTTINGQYGSAVYSLTDGSTIALNWNNGNVQKVTLGGNRTFTFANPVSGFRYMIELIQDGTGSRTITWPTIKWAGGSAPTLTTTASKTDLIFLTWDGTSYFGDISKNF